jgi:hypothetical protein
MVNLVWYGVPRRYLDSPNSYLLQYRGFINLRDFAVSQTTTFKKGSLLYLGCETVRTYVPPRFELTGAEDPQFSGTFSAETLVDLSLTFIHTTRTTSYPPAPAEIVRGSWLPYGHNLLGHVPTRGFYYASGAYKDVNLRVPSYLAIPLELIFQDPDSKAVRPA